MHIRSFGGYDFIFDDLGLKLLDSQSWRLNIRHGRPRLCQSGRGLMYFHRMLTNAPSGMEVDHINGNPLDQRMENLRICTKSQNLMNSKKSTRNKTGYKGVSFDNSERVKRPYRVFIRRDGKNVSLGNYSTAEEAHEVYKIASKMEYGEYARFE